MATTTSNTEKPQTRDITQANYIDSDLSLGDLRGLGSRFSKFKAAALVTHHLPTSSFRTDGGASVLQLDATAAQPLLDGGETGYPVNDGT